MSACYLCQKKKTIDNNVTLHKFPKDEKIRKQWIDACRLRESDNVSGLVLCSNHFKTKCFNDITISKGRILKRGSIPTQLFPPSFTQTLETSVDENSQSEIYQTSPSINSEDSSTPIQMISNICTNIKTETEQNEITEMTIKTEEFIETDEITIKEEIIKTEDISDTLDIRETKQEIIETEDFTNLYFGYNSTEQKLSTVKVRKFADPRYISEIVMSDVSTPEKANRVIKLINRIDQNKSKKIQYLQKTINRLVKRVNTLEKMLREKDVNVRVTKDTMSNNLKTKRKKKKVTSNIFARDDLSTIK